MFTSHSSLPDDTFQSGTFSGRNVLPNTNLSFSDVSGQSLSFRLRRRRRFSSVRGRRRQKSGKMNWEELYANKPRKKRAIGYLATRILNELPYQPKEYESWEITVEQIVQKFDASRGSVYEVFHVFEALLLVSKIGKNAFRWNGFKNMTQTLGFLRFIGLMLNIHGEIAATREREVAEMVNGNHLRLKMAMDQMRQCSNCTFSESNCHCYDAISNLPSESVNDNAQVAQEVVVADVPKLHILTVCQKFIMLFLVAQDQGIMSLEFASKVIHGPNLPENMQKSKARRLYDVSNVMMAINLKYPLIEKVNVPRLQSIRRTAFRYCGPELEDIPVDCFTIASLPDYRRKHLLFDYGKHILNVPILPEKIPGLTTIRRKATEKPWPWPIEEKPGLKMELATVTDLHGPLPIEKLVMMEAKRLKLTSVDLNTLMNSQIIDLQTYELIELPVAVEEISTDQEQPKDDQPNQIVIPQGESVIISEIIVEVNTFPVLDDKVWSILPDQSSLMDFF